MCYWGLLGLSMGLGRIVMGAAAYSYYMDKNIRKLLFISRYLYERSAIIPLGSQACVGLRKRRVGLEPRKHTLLKHFTFRNA